MGCPVLRRVLFGSEEYAVISRLTIDPIKILDKIPAPELGGLVFVVKDPLTAIAEDLSDLLDIGALLTGKG
jgi:hypothetical protein